jgi:hypothetical protein
MRHSMQAEGATSWLQLWALRRGCCMAARSCLPAYARSPLMRLASWMSLGMMVTLRPYDKNRRACEGQG